MLLDRRHLLASLAAGAAVLTTGGAIAAPAPRGLRAVKRPLPIRDLAVRSADGGELEFRELKGRPSALVFWATWCGVCHGEMPKLNALQAELGDAANIVTISVDRGGAAQVLPYMKRRELTALTPYLDQDGVVASMLGVRAVPTIFVLNSAGRIAAIGQGRIDWDGDKARDFLMSLS